jgi:hypothetical protein
MMLYIPEIPPRARISAFLERADYFLISKGFDLSLWSDELVIEGQAPSNWKKAQEAVRLAMKGAE